MKLASVNSSLSMADLPRVKSRRAASGFFAGAHVVGYASPDWATSANSQMTTPLKTWTFRDGASQATELLDRLAMHSYDRVTAGARIGVTGNTPPHLIFRAPPVRTAGGTRAAVIEVSIVLQGRNSMVQFDEYVDCTQEGLRRILFPRGAFALLFLPVFYFRFALKAFAPVFFPSAKAVFLVEQSGQALRSAVVSSVADAAEELGLMPMAG